MRQGRFAGLGAPGQGHVEPPGLADLFLLEFRACQDEEGEKVAAERARSLGLSLPFLAVSHLVWTIILLHAIVRDRLDIDLIATGGLLGASLVIDVFLCWLLSRRRTRQLRPHNAMRIAAVGVVVTTALWCLAIVSAPAAADSLLARAALLAGTCAAIPAFFASPVILLMACLVTMCGVSLVPGGSPLLPVGMASSLFLFWLSLFRTRDLIFGARRRLAMEWEAKKARRFVSDFEKSARGWFWETNADGHLTYLSQELARLLGADGDSLIGRPLEGLLQVRAAEGGGEARTLGFHLNARFPFEDVIVRAPGSEEVWWQVSGSPNFDPYGRFLGFRGLGTNLTEQKRNEAEASKLARFDTLTGLPNRAMMRRTLDDALENAAERRRGCALMMIDLDRFKHVNDTLGHPMGDKLLRQVAERLTKVIGKDGQVGRLGGDEFEAILPGIEEQGGLAAIAGRLIEEVSKVYSIDGHEISIGASVGIAVARPGKTYAMALVKEADLAVYAAKNGGRGTFRFFADEMHTEVTDRQILEADLREALGKGQLHLLYQPEVNSVGEEIVAFEALLRWKHPLRGTIEPLTIIPLAEECGAIGAIGDWVIRSACAEAAKWPSHVRVAVNLSPAQFADPSLAATVTSAIAAAGIEPERLELEISEEVFLADGKATEKVLSTLRAIGVRLALDNFGTGGSGLGHLRDAPLDKIKIDQSFVRGASAPGSRNAAIVRAIVVLAESLGMDTTAEGAETLEELALIRRLGCSQVQGFIFSVPVPAEEAERLASQSRPPAEVPGFTRPPRHRLIRTGRLHWDGKSLDVRLRNISAGGAMIECERPIPADTRVELDLADSGRHGAEVRWSQQGRVGLRFDREFELRRLSPPKPRPIPAKQKMMTPDYLNPGAEPQPAVRSPLVAKRRRSK